MTTQTRLFVGGIPCDVTNDNLKDSFSKFGNVSTCELKRKPADPDNQFAFITLNANHNDIEECIQHFSKTQWRGHHLHVTRARESFLERLQKERQQTLEKKPIEVEHKTSDDYDGSFNIKKPQTPNFNIKKPGEGRNNGYQIERRENNAIKKNNKKYNFDSIKKTEIVSKTKFDDTKKLDADKKRLESMRKMRQDFNEKRHFIKSGLAGVDKVNNKRIKFDDDGDHQLSETTGDPKKSQNKEKRSKTLFNDDDNDEDDDNINFQIKEQYEGKKGQKVLELQSRFKSDKRFTLDERFIEDADDMDAEFEAEKTVKTNDDKNVEVEDEVQVLGENEKARQLSILENVLGHSIKSRHTQPQEVINDSKKQKVKMAMLRFDPSQPDHAKFLVPKENIRKEENTTTKKNKRKEDPPPQLVREVEKVEVSKEQFYKVSETLKEAIAQPNTFSLRSLFSKDQVEEEKEAENNEDASYIPLPGLKKDKVKNPLDTGAKNPFKYDSSDSEPEADDKEEIKPGEEQTDDNKTKAVWREKFFFAKFDVRFKEGLAFFNSLPAGGNKDRRELKSLMKKRLYNHARKDQMFQKKIGGKKQGRKQRR